MRLTVTPLGAAGRTAAGVAAAVVDYLEGKEGDRGTGLAVSESNGLTGAGRYYADSIEGPGRWLGSGAGFRGLSGVVDRESFRSVLEGRHPMTGERLVTARGSSQRSHLAVGTVARFDGQGRPLYTLADVASLLGMSRSEVDDLVAAGQPDAGAGGDLTEGLAVILDSVHGPLVPDREVTRLLESASRPIDAAAVRLTGSADDELSVSQAARVLCVSARYVRRLCAAGEKPQSNRSTASLSAGRDENGDYRIRRADLADFAGRRRPPVARVGFDLTLTVEKSIGLIAMLSDGPRQQRILDALSTANEVAIGCLDRHASVTRRRGEMVASEGLLAASYMHATSRALDPHPHFHNVIANAVVDDEGGVRALDARALYRQAPAAAALATAAARWELRDLGLGWWRRPEGIWEVAGVDRAAIREFSQRRNEMDEVRRALEERLGRTISHHEEDTVAVSTRADKVASDPAELRESWQDRADRVGLDIDSCFDRADRAIAFEVLPDELHERLFRDLVDSEDGLCARANTFGTGDVMRGIADWSILDSNGVARKVLVPPREVERLTARFCATGLVVEVGVATGTMRRRNRTAISDGLAAPTFTTVELLGVQHRIMEIIDEGLGAGFGQADAAITGRAISDAKHLSGEQAGLVAAWLTSGDRVQCAIGRAGTGKTTTMRVAASAWTAAGYRVIGAAIKGEAARQLATDAGIETETVAMLLARSRAGVRVLDSRTVLIVDEASTLGDRDLLALCEIAIETGATVRLIGDTAQHGSVAAGGTFAELADRDDRVPHLTTVHRLTDPAELKRANLVRSGRASTAIDELVASGQLALTESDGATHAAMVARWYEARAVGRAHPMVHGRNRERRFLNSMAQRLLVDDGIVDGDDFVMLDDGRRLCVGDEVVAKHGDRTIFVDTDRSAWMRNGTTGRVSTVRLDPDNAERDEIDISTDAGSLTCSRATFDREQGGIDLAYAMTSYGVQGSTMDVSTSAITASTGRSEMYVDMTRGRHQNQLFGTRPVVVASDDDRRLPTLDTELPEALEARLARGVGAIALSLTGSAASIEWARDLKGLVALRREGDRSDGLAAAIARASSAIRRVAVCEPPPTLRRLLPSEPTCPHLARRWREVVGEIAVYLAANGPRVRHDQRGLPGVIGSRPSTAVGEEWDVVSTVVCRLVSDIVCRQLVDHASEASHQELADLIRQQPNWLSHHLDVLTGAGRLVDPNIEELAGTIQRVHHWRIDHRLDETTPPDRPLGPTPSDPLDRSRHRALSAELVIAPDRRDGRGVA